MTDLVSRTLGQYQIKERIGQGGMAAVYRAYQPSLDRYVAVKVLPLLYAGQPGFQERFVREARAIANLNHPNILPVHDFGHEGDYTFIVMRYIEGGRTLQQVMSRSLSLAQISDLIGQIAAALDYAHRQGIIHRDVKPSNVLMDGNWALLSDFGLAKVVESSVKLTGSDTGIGTPAYMSPEQAQGDPIDHRTDIYALGIILFEMLTGEVPHQAGTPMGILIKRTLEPMPAPRSLNPAIPEAVEAVVLKALAYKPSDRFASAQLMAAALRASMQTVQVPFHSPGLPAPEEDVTISSSGPSPGQPDPSAQPGAIRLEAETQPVGPIPISGVELALEATGQSPQAEATGISPNPWQPTISVRKRVPFPLLGGILLLLLLGIGFLSREAVWTALFPANTATPTATLAQDLALLEIVSTDTPTPSPTATQLPTPTPTATALPVLPAAKDETLILIATFYTAEGIINTDVHHEIRLAIEEAIAELELSNFRVAVEPTALRAEEQAEARTLGERYNASVVIWGGDTGVRITINYLNLKQPRLPLSQARISETERTQMANPSAYASFVTRDLPAQLTFLALFTVGESYYIEQAYAEAARVIERAVTPFASGIEPPEGVADAYFRLGWLYQAPLRDVPAAITAYDRVIEHDPNYVVAYYNRALAYAYSGNPAQAIQDYSQAIRLNPKYTFAYYNRGLAYAAGGDLERAIADYAQAVTLEPGYANGWNNLCWFKSLAGQTEAVLEACERAITLDPENATFYDSRGLARALTGDKQGAIEDFQVYVAWLKENNRYEPNGPKRDAWIAALEAGENPFDEATLEALRTE
jgi:serine/threonine protein kinase/tetratricopeptide (TPR) repeat protein